tara:strand:- start:855 stop:1292 length:438 start_codon:yes stop_codon:yes gene_type:complete
MYRHIHDLLSNKNSAPQLAQLDESILSIIQTMSHHNIGSVIIMDEDRNIAGIVTERIIINALNQNFSLNKLHASDIMKPCSELVILPPEAMIRDAMQLMTEKKCRHIPIMINDELIGIISIGDITKFIIDNQKQEINSLREYITQ